MKLAAPVHSTTVLPVHTQPNSCVFTWVVSLGGAHTTALQCICAHMAPVLTSAVSFGDLPTTPSVHTWPLFSPLQCPLVVCLQQHCLCTHGPCSHSAVSFGNLPTTTLSVQALPVFSLCSVLWWSAYNNTICAGITCVLTSVVSFGGLPTTTLSVHALPVFSPL